MPRRPSYTHREPPAPDPKYKSALVGRLVGKMNFEGKKTLITSQIYKAMDYIQEKSKEDPLVVLSRAVENCRPLLETKPRQVGGATYQVPVEVRRYRGETLSMRWLIMFARKRKGSPIYLRFGEEILMASRREGAAFKKREDMHKMAESNRAFAHYRW